MRDAASASRCASKSLSTIWLSWARGARRHSGERRWQGAWPNVSRRQAAERLAAKLNEAAGEPIALAHHGSVAKDRRAQIEDPLKRGQLPALVACAAALEQALGGYVEATHCPRNLLDVLAQQRVAMLVAERLTPGAGLRDRGSFCTVS